MCTTYLLLNKGKEINAPLPNIFLHVAFRSPLERSVIAAVDCDEGNSDDEVDFEYQQELPVDDDTLRQVRNC